MSDYKSAYERLFVRNLNRYAAIRKNIKRRVDRILGDPYHNTELLVDSIGKMNLIGCRSARVDRSFRIIFVLNSATDPHRKTQTGKDLKKQIVPD